MRRNADAGVSLHLRTNHYLSTLKNAKFEFLTLECLECEIGKRQTVSLEDTGSYYVKWRVCSQLLNPSR